MKTKIRKKTSNLTSYLAVTAGVGCAPSVANAAITVQLFGAGQIPATLSGGDTIDIIGDPFTASPLYGGYYAVGGNFGLVGGIGSFRSTDSPSTPDSSDTFFEYNYNLPAGSFNLGAQSGSDNFVFLDQNNDGTYETLLHFTLDGHKGGLLLGAAEESTGADINYGDAVTALSVPEPSGLALLALGSVGLAVRRKRRDKELGMRN